MRHCPADDMTRTRSYRFFTRHRGSSKLHEYTGLLMKVSESEMVFMSLDNPGVLHRVEKACIESFALLADADLSA